MGQQSNGSRLNTAIWHMLVCGQQNDSRSLHGSASVKQKPDPAAVPGNSPRLVTLRLTRCCEMNDVLQLIGHGLPLNVRAVSDLRHVSGTGISTLCNSEPQQGLRVLHASTCGGGGGGPFKGERAYGGSVAGAWRACGCNRPVKGDELHGGRMVRVWRASGGNRPVKGKRAHGGHVAARGLSKGKDAWWSVAGVWRQWACQSGKGVLRAAFMQRNHTVQPSAAPLRSQQPGTRDGATADVCVTSQCQPGTRDGATADVHEPVP
eukprot:58844-Chlamydomonas_euryale.AAC.1